MTTLKSALVDLLDNTDLPLEQAANRHLNHDFRQQANGEWVSRTDFLSQIAELRSSITHVTVTVLDELLDNDRYAERHTIDLLLRDGQRITQEVYLFATLDHAGRFTHITEITRPIAAKDTGTPSAGPDRA